AGREEPAPGGVVQIARAKLLRGREEMQVAAVRQQLIERNGEIQVPFVALEAQVPAEPAGDLQASGQGPADEGKAVLDGDAARQEVRWRRLTTFLAAREVDGEMDGGAAHRLARGQQPGAGIR